jgi:tetratricopeptide (TPR) repeat protein
LIRNPNWDSDLALANADLKTSPQSARLHDMLALALFTRDPLHSIDRVIQEQSTSCQILSSLPPGRSSDRPLTYLGMYNLFKAKIVPTSEAGYWRDQALNALIHARTISTASEKAYATNQELQGDRPKARLSYDVLYFTLGDIYNEMGRYPEAIDALRFGRGIAPDALRAYDGLSAAYLKMGDLNSAVISLQEKALLDGSQPQTLAAISEIYRHIPDASCAFVPRGAGWQLNSGCPRVKIDLCQAHADLARAWEESLQPKQAHDLGAEAQNLGCH